MIRALACVLACFVVASPARAAISKRAALAKAATVFCAPGFSCDPGVGMLSIGTRTELGQCTAVLIAPNLVATNAHCVPPEMRHPGASCAGQLWMNFVPAPGLESQLACGRVLLASGADKEGVADYAILAMTESSRRPFHPISRAGFPAGESFRMEKVTPVDDTPAIVGRQEENRECPPLVDSFFAPRFLHAGSPVVSLKGCASVEGNSGSPLFAADGSLRGLHFAVEEIDAEWLRAKHISMPAAHAKTINYNSNFACLELPDEAGAGMRAGSCDAGPAENAAYRAVRRAGGIRNLGANDLESYEPVRNGAGQPLRIELDADGLVLGVR